MVRIEKSDIRETHNIAKHVDQENADKVTYQYREVKDTDKEWKETCSHIDEGCISAK